MARYENFTVTDLYVDNIYGLHSLSSDVVDFGEDADGVDVKFYGDTSGVYVLWDESADSLCFNSADITVSNAQIQFSSADGAPFVFANDGCSDCADMASAVSSTINAVVKVKVGATTTYLVGYDGYTAA